jgi:hypothetical protein
VGWQSSSGNGSHPLNNTPGSSVLVALNATISNCFFKRSLNQLELPSEGKGHTFESCRVHQSGYRRRTLPILRPRGARETSRSQVQLDVPGAEVRDRPS